MVADLHKALRKHAAAAKYGKVVVSQPVATALIDSALRAKLTLDECITSNKSIYPMAAVAGSENELTRAWKLMHVLLTGISDATHVEGDAQAIRTMADRMDADAGGTAIAMKGRKDWLNAVVTEYQYKCYSFRLMEGPRPAWQDALDDHEHEWDQDASFEAQAARFREEGWAPRGADPMFQPLQGQGTGGQQKSKSQQRREKEKARKEKAAAAKREKEQPHKPPTGQPKPGSLTPDNPVAPRFLEYARPSVSTEKYQEWCEATRTKYPGWCRQYLLNKKKGCIDGDCKLKHTQPPQWDEHVATCGK